MDTIDMTPQIKPLMDALIRVVAASWPARDENAEHVLVEAIEELVRLRAERQHLDETARWLTSDLLAVREVLLGVAHLQARESYEPIGEFPGRRVDIVLHSDKVNVVWLRDQARTLVKKDLLEQEWQRE